MNVKIDGVPMEDVKVDCTTVTFFNRVEGYNKIFLEYTDPEVSIEGDLRFDIYQMSWEWDRASASSYEYSTRVGSQLIGVEPKSTPVFNFPNRTPAGVTNRARHLSQRGL